MSDWKERFATLGFRPTEYGAMRGRFEDIDLTAVEHPFNGLCLMGNHYDGRSASEFETYIPVDSDFQAIAAALVRIYELVHPKKAAAPPPKPERPRPSNEEALAAVPGLMKQLYGALDEMSFLFRDSLMPSGYLDARIGEIVAAYIYDLELTRTHLDFSEATSSDGRTVQVRSTRAHKSRETVALEHVGEHLVVVQLWGREVVELYNGPLEPIWERARRVQQDGKRRISVGRLRGSNKYGPFSTKKLEAKRTWKFEQQMDDYDGRL